MFPGTARCVVLAVRRLKGGDQGGERGRGGRLFKLNEIVTIHDKMWMEEVLNNTGWTSADAERIGLLLNRPAVCGVAFTGAHQHHHHDHLIILVAPLEQADFGDATGMEALTEDDRWLLLPPCFFLTSPLPCV